MTVTFPAGIPAQAEDVWNSSITTFGRTVACRANDGSPDVTCKAFCKRPKILGLFDRTEQSYDQTRYMVMVRASDMPAEGPLKFDRVRWNEQDHAVLSVTEVDLGTGVFGYRLLVKG
jgi:hypothetical protein